MDILHQFYVLVRRLTREAKKESLIRDYSKCVSEIDREERDFRSWIQISESAQRARGEGVRSGYPADAPACSKRGQMETHSGVAKFTVSVI